MSRPGAKCTLVLEKLWIKKKTARTTLKGLSREQVGNGQRLPTYSAPMSDVAVTAGAQPLDATWAMGSLACTKACMRGVGGMGGVLMSCMAVVV